MMDVRPVRDEADYDWALCEIEQYFEHEPLPGTADGDRFDVLATLIEAYENRTVRFPAIDAADALNFAINHLGRSQTELSGLLGSRSRASEILSRKRGLTVAQIAKIAKAWHLPADLLIEHAPPSKVA